MTEHKRIAKVTSTFLGFEDHDLFTVGISVEYGGCGQTLGLFALGRNRDGDHDIRPTKAGAEFIMRVLRACGVREWSAVKGRTIFVIADSDAFNARPLGIENLPTEPGERFMFADVQDRAKYEYEVERELIRDKKLDTSRWLVGWETP